MRATLRDGRRGTVLAFRKKRSRWLYLIELDGGGRVNVEAKLLRERPRGRR